MRLFHIRSLAFRYTSCYVLVPCSQIVVVYLSQNFVDFAYTARFHLTRLSFVVEGLYSSVLGKTSPARILPNPQMSLVHILLVTHSTVPQSKFVTLLLPRHLFLSWYVRLVQSQEYLVSMLRSLTLSQRPFLLSIL